ncbi:DUF6296 family protein [Kitasatospora sp. RB6PN24]|uniref:DUF6296 family protein n=1 Tax=Kitasatospora humi TaxID=2893891 RepID=UPI001E4B5140|nr:DUF6296 family protein [Kitasatospora humi]MCC9310986.1 DUF6296 family protein [Kitasatospora humi]
MTVNATERYAVALPGAVGAHSPAQVVIVHPTDDVGDDGGRVWTDATGRFRMEITREVAMLLAAPGGYDRHPCLHAVPLP